MSRHVALDKLDIRRGAILRGQDYLGELLDSVGFALDLPRVAYDAGPTMRGIVIACHHHGAKLDTGRNMQAYQAST